MATEIRSPSRSITVRCNTTLRLEFRIDRRRHCWSMMSRDLFFNRSQSESRAKSSNSISICSGTNCSKATHPSGNPIFTRGCSGLPCSIERTSVGTVTSPVAALSSVSPRWRRSSTIASVRTSVTFPASGSFDRTSISRELSCGFVFLNRSVEYHQRRRLRTVHGTRCQGRKFGLHHPGQDNLAQPVWSRLRYRRRKPERRGAGSSV